MDKIFENKFQLAKIFLHKKFSCIWYLCIRFFWQSDCTWFVACSNLVQLHVLLVWMADKTTLCFLSGEGFHNDGHYTCIYEVHIFASQKLSHTCSLKEKCKHILRPNCFLANICGLLDYSSWIVHFHSCNGRSNEENFGGFLAACMAGESPEHCYGHQPQGGGQGQVSTVLARNRGPELWPILCHSRRTAGVHWLHHQNPLCQGELETQWQLWLIHIHCLLIMHFIWSKTSILSHTKWVTLIGVWPWSP